MRYQTPRRALTRAAAGLIGLTLVAAACGDDDDDDDSAPAVTATAEAGATTGSPAPEPTSTPAGGGEDDGPTVPEGDLRVGTRAAFVTWDPMASRKQADLAYYGPVYEGLFEFDADGQLRPQLVADYEVTNEAITLQLVPDVTFHDGTPFNAEAVKFNLERVRDNPGFSQASLASVADIEVVDDLTVRLVLSTPSPQIPYALGRLAGQMVSPEAVESGALVETPIGTGPWRFVAAESSSTEFVFEANPDYRDQSVIGVRRIHLFPEVDGPSPFSAGDIDIASFNTEDRAQMERVGAMIAEGPNIGRSFVFIDRGPGGVFEDVRVRQAVAHAIDREAFRDVAMSGTGDPQAVPATGNDYAAADDLVGLEYDPERAQQLLAEAGVENLRFDLPVYGPFIAQGEALQAILAQVGIDISLVQIESTVGMVQSCASGEYAACIIPDDTVHPAHLHETYVAEDAVLNPAGVVTPEVQAAADAAYQEPDLEAGEARWTEYFRAVFEEDLPMTYIIRELNQAAYDPDVLADGLQMRYRVQAGVDYRTARFK